MNEEKLLIDFMKWLENYTSQTIGDYTFKARAFLKHKKDFERIRKVVLK